MIGTPVGSKVEKMSTGMWIADRRIYLNVNGEVVEEGSPFKDSLLVAVGGKLPMARALELGLVEPVKSTKGEQSPESVNVDQLTEAITAKDEEINKLKAEIATLKSTKPEDAKPVLESDKKAEDPDKDKAVKPVADKAVVPDKNK